jgi:carboxyl-terminal processing protease
MLAALGDQYTVLIEPPAARLESDQLRGEFGGVGADVRRDAAGRTLLSPYPDGPAARAGVVEGDELTAVDGKPVAELPRLDEIEALLRGDVGSGVRLTLVREGQAFDVEVERANVAPPSTMWRVLAETPDIGYISIRLFTDRTADEVRQALEDLRGQGARALILDIRDNGGGLLDAAVDVTGQFIDGVVLIERKRDEMERQFTAAADGAARDMPLVVLVNHSTASASEIVAGALRDRKQVKLIGERTYGKGSVQNVYPLSDGSSLHVTTSEWYTPNRAKLTGLGLLPDIEVIRTAEDRAAGRDPVLDRAVEYLQVTGSR